MPQGLVTAHRIARASPVDDRGDDDGDGIRAAVDDDGRWGQPALDLLSYDDDGDQIPSPYDRAERGRDSGDSNRDGRLDAVQCAAPPAWPRCPDVDNDGQPDYMEASDMDGDGVPDADDLDVDNDGLPNWVENRMGIDPMSDSDGDGIPNYVDLDDRGDTTAGDCPAETAANGRCPVALASFDDDRDGAPNHADLDSDGDGLPDVIEAGHGLADDDGDGMVDGACGPNGLSDSAETEPESGIIRRAVLNTDGALPTGDDTPDFLDLDSDGDGTLDIAEVSALAREDSDGDGRIDDAGDLDHDGLMAFSDADPALFGFPHTAGKTALDNSDSDVIPDAYDGDAPGVDMPGDTDGDGLSDELECPGGWPCPDENGDGIPNYADASDLGVVYGVQGGGCAAAGGDDGAGALLLVLVGFIVMLGRSRRRALASRVRVLAALAVTLTLALSAPASAQMIDIDTQYAVERFRLSTDRRGILDVEWAGVSPHRGIDVGLWLGYADDPLNLYQRMDDGSRERVASLVSQRLGGALVSSIGLAGWFQIGLALRMVVAQEQDLGPIEASAPLTSFGTSDIRVVPKFQLLRQDRHGVTVGVATGLSIPTVPASDYRNSDGMVFAPELMIGRVFASRLRTALNVGYRLRRERRSLDLVVGDEVFAHAGLAYQLTRAVELDTTFALATRSDAMFSEFNQNYGEFKAGGQVAFGRWVAFAAGGVGVQEGYGTPDWRALAGVRVGSAPAKRQLVSATTVVEAEPPAPPAPQPVADLDLDPDRDGIPSARDACPEQPENRNGFEDEDGCPDTIGDRDGDRLDDLRDQCPGMPEDLDGFQDEDGCPDVDNDGDGVLDSVDNCADEAGTIENRGCPDTDRDGDTIVDRLDNCPDVAGTAEFHGCLEPQLVSIAKDKLEILDKVYFRTGNASIRRRSYPLLRNIAQVLIAHPEIKTVNIEGHTDDRGSDSYNRGLSQARADSVLGFLVAEGVAPERLRAIGYGENRPIADNSRSSGREFNRRVEFVIVY